MLAQFNIFPLGSNVSVSSDVAKALAIIDGSGLNYRLNAMNTVMEGNINDILNVVKKCYEELQKNNERLIITLMLDDRKDQKSSRIDSKVASVEAKIGKELKK
jgi:uncharacterized protein (TIGR00106 family)